MDGAVEGMTAEEVTKAQNVAVYYLICDWVLLSLFFLLLFFRPEAWLLVVLVPFVASRQHALIVLMHEAYHGNLGPNRRWSVLLGRWLCGFPLGLAFGSSRDYHLRHHRDLNSALDVYWMATRNDPEWVFPMRAHQFLWISLKDWLGLGFRTLTMFETLYLQKEYAGWWQRLAFRFGFGAVLFSIACALSRDVGRSVLLLALWFVAKYTALVWFNRVRTVSEHYGIVGGLTRNVVAGWVETFFFVPHRSGLHELHHRYASRPLAGLNKDQVTQIDSGFLVSDGVIRQVLRTSLHS